MKRRVWCTGAVGCGYFAGERASAFECLAAYAEQMPYRGQCGSGGSPVEPDAGAVSLLVNYNTMYFAPGRV